MDLTKSSEGIKKFFSNATLRKSNRVNYTNFSIKNTHFALKLCLRTAKINLKKSRALSLKNTLVKSKMLIWTLIISFAKNVSCQAQLSRRRFQIHYTLYFHFLAASRFNSLTYSCIRDLIYLPFTH